MTSARSHARMWGMAALVLATGWWLTNLAFGRFLLDAECGVLDDEGLIPAPASLGFQLLCGPGQSHWIGWLVVPPLLVLAVGLWLWFTRRRVRWVLAAALVIAALPAGTLWLVLEVLPDTCSEWQWDEFGEDGCERDLERR